MTDAIFAYGTLLQIGDGAGPENFTTISEVKNISGPEFTLDTEDVTSHSSPGGWREFIATLLDGGELTFQLNFRPTHGTHDRLTGLQKKMFDRIGSNYRVRFTDTAVTTITFKAIVTRFGTNEPVDGALTADVTLKVTGQPTWS